MFEKMERLSAPQNIPELIAEPVAALYETLQGPDTVATALVGLRGHLDQLSGLELPQDEAVVAVVRPVLQAEADAGFAGELRSNHLLDSVMPNGTVTVDGSSLGLSSMMSAARFRRLGGTDADYAQVRNTLKAEIRDALWNTASEPAQVFIDNARIVSNYHAELSGRLGTEITLLRELILEDIGPVHRSFTDFVMGRSVQYREKEVNGTVNVNRVASRLAGQLAELAHDPLAYIGKTLPAQWYANDAYREQGIYLGEQRAREIVAAMLPELNDRLDKILSNREEPRQESQNNTEAVTDPHIEIPVIEAGQTSEAHSETAHTERFSMLAPVRINTPWTSEDATSELFVFHDGHGNQTLALDAFSDGAEAVRRQSINNKGDESMFDDMWQRVIGKSLSARLSVSGTVGYQRLRTKKNDTWPEYKDVSIRYDGPNRPNAPRLYFTEVLAGSLLDSHALQACGANPQDLVVVRLGVCKKATQVRMLQVFTNGSVSSLRDQRTGSI